MPIIADRSAPVTRCLRRTYNRLSKEKESLLVREGTPSFYFNLSNRSLPSITYNIMAPPLDT